MKRIAGEQKLGRQAERLAEALRRAGEPEEEVQRRVQNALQSALDRGANRRPLRGAEHDAANPFVGCRSVTVVAGDLRMRRVDLFGWLEQEGWFFRGISGKLRPTPSAVSNGFAVLRGPASIQYGQITPLGRAELARRLIKSVDGEPIS